MLGTAYGLIGIPTQGIGLGLRLDADEELRGLYIPPGVAHGFYAMQDVLLEPYGGEILG